MGKSNRETSTFAILFHKTESILCAWHCYYIWRFKCLPMYIINYLLFIILLRVSIAYSDGIDAYFSHWKVSYHPSVWMALRLCLYYNFRIRKKNNTFQSIGNFSLFILCNDMKIQSDWDSMDIELRYENCCVRCEKYWQKFDSDSK